jgi:hypothetical protein
MFKGEFAESGWDYGRYAVEADAIASATSDPAGRS